MTNTNQQALKPGEIKLDYIPVDWPLTPLGPNKDPYIAGWQNKPLSPKEIEDLKGTIKAKDGQINERNKKITDLESKFKGAIVALGLASLGFIIALL